MGHLLHSLSWDLGVGGGWWEEGNPGLLWDYNQPFLTDRIWKKKAPSSVSFCRKPVPLHSDTKPPSVTLLFLFPHGARGRTRSHFQGDFLKPGSVSKKASWKKSSHASLWKWQHGKIIVKLGSQKKGINYSKSLSSSYKWCNSCAELGSYGIILKFKRIFLVSGCFTKEHGINLNSRLQTKQMAHK